MTQQKDPFSMTAGERIASLSSRCEKLNAMCIELATDYAKAEAERDEARQWARKYKVAYEDTEREALRALDALTNAGAESIVEISDYAIEQQNKLKAENADLRAQLAEARNKALDEAVTTARNIVWSRLPTSYNRTQVIDALVVGLIALKESS